MPSNTSNRPYACAVLSAACGLALAANAAPAMAQSLDTFYMLPERAGTNLVDVTASYTHDDRFQYSNGVKLSNVNLDEFGASVRYARYFSVFDHPAALQVIQPFSYFASWQINGFDNANASGMHQLGAGNTTLSALFWPYANATAQTYIFTGAYLGLPDGSYSPTNAMNAAYGGWSGDAQIGAVKGFGRNLSLEAAFDINFSGNESRGSGFYQVQYGYDPAYRVQLWGNWDWGNGLRTALGYTGIFGGQLNITEFGMTFQGNRNAERQRLRAEVAYWWTPRVLTILEIAHDLEANGGYAEGIGGTLKARILF